MQKKKGINKKDTKVCTYVKINKHWLKTVAGGSIGSIDDDMRSRGLNNNNNKKKSNQYDKVTIYSDVRFRE